MKKIILAFFLLCTFHWTQAQTYTPTTDNLAARQWFRDAHFGMFIHWGLFSLLGNGEWVLNNRNIPFENYKLLEKSFNPVDFDADAWVATAKNAGMKYITLVTRHHDGFSLWDTKYSDFNITHTPYKKDIVRQIVDACHKADMKIFLYYSLLDWGRTDYAYWTGRTGQGTGRKEKGNWNDYIQFMKNQLTELLSNYGKIDGIWFDGYWDQLNPESANRKHEDTKIDWHLPEIYQHIHDLQPQCLIGNNHHLSTLPGEDFQMFEQDIPGENSHGLSFQEASASLPVETCATMNNNWGYDIKDDHYKSLAELIRLLVKSAGAGANLLLNIGPLPNGEIQPQFTARLDSMRTWLHTYGESIYHTTGGYLGRQQWGVITQTPDKLYLHFLSDTSGTVELPRFPFKKITKAYTLKSMAAVSASLKKGTAVIGSIRPSKEDPDAVVVVEVK